MDGALSTVKLELEAARFRMAPRGLPKPIDRLENALYPIAHGTRRFEVCDGHEIWTMENPKPGQFVADRSVPRDHKVTRSHDFDRKAQYRGVKGNRHLASAC